MFPILALLIASELTTAGAPPKAIPQYSVHVSVRETYTGSVKKPGVILAEPIMMVSASREASYQVGDAITIKGEKIPSGTSIKIKVDPEQNEQVHVVGAIEISSLSKPVDDIVARDSRSIHLSKTMTCGRQIQICMSKTPDSETWCLVQVDHARE